MIHPRWVSRLGADDVGEAPRGPLLPFEAVVILKPFPTRSALRKPPPTASIGIFLGYRVARGGHWHGEYLVEELSYFVDVDF
jgi:hypothetical protein